MNENKISSIYPTTKGLVVLLTIILSLFLNWKFSYLVVLPVCIVLAGLDNQLLSYIKKIGTILPIVVLVMFLFRFLLDNSDSAVYFSLGILKVTEEGISKGLGLTKAVITMISVLTLFFSTTELEDLMIALQKMKLSHVATFVILSTMQMVPKMMEQSEVIMDAQRARGIETEGNMVQRAKAFIPSLGPLIVSSITEVEDRMVTLDVRGFSSDKEKTSLKDIRKKSTDKRIEIAAVLLFLGLIVWRVVA